MPNPSHDVDQQRPQPTERIACFTAFALKTSESISMRVKLDGLAAIRVRLLAEQKAQFEPKSSVKDPVSSQLQPRANSGRNYYCHAWRMSQRVAAAAQDEVKYRVWSSVTCSRQRSWRIHSLPPSRTISHSFFSTLNPRLQTCTAQTPLSSQSFNGLRQMQLRSPSPHLTQFGSPYRLEASSTSGLTGTTPIWILPN